MKIQFVSYDVSTKIFCYQVEDIHGTDLIQAKAKRLGLKTQSIVNINLASLIPAAESKADPLEYFLVEFKNTFIDEIGLENWKIFLNQIETQLKRQFYIGDLNCYANMPEDIEEQISFYLDDEARLQLSRTQKKLYANMQEATLYTHFPVTYRRLKAEHASPQEFRAALIREEKIQYIDKCGMQYPARVKLFARLWRENDIDAIQQNKYQFKELLQCAFDKELQILATQKRTSLQDYLYNAIVKPFYTTENNEIDLNKKDKDGSTLLCWAVWLHQPLSCIEDLLKNKFDPYLVLGDDESIFDVCACVGNLNAFEYFYEKSQLEKIDFDVNQVSSGKKQSIAHRTLLNNYFLSRLVELKADLHLVDNTGSNVIHYICIKNNVEGLQLMLEHSVAFDLPDNWGNTPLGCAVGSNAVECLKVLINSKARLEFPNQEGAAPIHFAARLNSFESLKLLVEHKVDVNRPVPSGARPIDIAIEFNSKASAIYLIQHGANYLDPSPVNNKTPVQNAVIAKNKYVANYIAAQPAFLAKCKEEKAYLPDGLTKMVEEDVKAFMKNSSSHASELAELKNELVIQQNTDSLWKKPLNPFEILVAHSLLSQYQEDKTLFSQRAQDLLDLNLAPSLSGVLRNIAPMNNVIYNVMG